jgi:hypothetical protein
LSESITKGTGPDGIPFTLIKALPKRIKEDILKSYQIAFRKGTIPEHDVLLLGKMVNIWKKKGSGSKPEEWRSLVVSQTIFTLFMKIIAKRLISLMLDMGVLSKRQKANLPGINGPTDWNLYLRAVLLDLRLSRGPSLPKYLTIILTDIWKAFDTVDRGVMIESIQCVLGDDIGKELIGIVSTLYQHRKVVVQTDEGEKILEKRRGTDQGNPLSGILFIIVMEFATRLVTSKEDGKHGYLFNNKDTKEHPEAIFADDNARITGGRSELEATYAAQTDLNMFNAQISAVGLKLSIDKCKVVTMVASCGPRGGKRNTRSCDLGIMLDGIPLQTMDKLESFRNLWINAEGDQKADVDRRISNFMTTLHSITRCGLNSTRKLDAWKKTATMYLNHTFGYITWAPDDLIAMTTQLRKEVRKLWNVQWLPNAVMHAPSKEVGGLQLPDLYEIYSIKHVTQFAKTLWGGDERISSVLWSNIITVQQFHSIPVRRTSRNKQGTNAPPFSHGVSGRKADSET